MNCDTKKLIEASNRLTVKEAAELFNVTVHAIYRKIRIGELEAHSKAQNSTQFVRKRDLVKAFGLDYDELAAEEGTEPFSASAPMIQVVIPQANGMSIVYAADGKPQAIWIGEVGSGEKYYLSPTPPKVRTEANSTRA